MRIWLIAIIMFLSLNQMSLGQTVEPSAWQHLKKLEVQIIDPEGQPVEGAMVTPWAMQSSLGHGMWRTPDDNPKQPPTVVTDSNGKATVPYPELCGADESSRVTSVSCRVVHDDFADTAYNNVAVPQVGTSPITIERGALVKLAGTVDGELVPTDKLYGHWSSGGGNGYPVARGEAGFITLPKLVAKTQIMRLVQISDEAPLLFSEVKQVAFENDEEYPFILELRKGVRVEGELSANVPRPVRNGRVVARVISRDNGEHYEALCWTTHTKIQPDGSFQLESLPPGEPLQVIAICDGYFAANGSAPENIDDREKRITSHVRPQIFQLNEEVNVVQLAMQPTATVEAQVLENGQPMAGVIVECYPNVGWWNYGSSIYCQRIHRTKEWLPKPGPPNFTAGFGESYFYRAITDKSGLAVISTIPVNGLKRERVCLFRDEQYKILGKQAGYRMPIKPGDTTKLRIDIDQPDGTELLEGLMNKARELSDNIAQPKEKQ